MKIKCTPKELADFISQEWLITEVNKRVTITMSSSYLNRIMTGRVENSQAIPVINDILGIAS